MRGCAGAGSTQAHTLTCRSPPPLALHPCLHLSEFWVLSNSDRAPVFLSGTCLDQAGARFGLALASGCLCLLRLMSRLDRCQCGFGGGSRPLVFFRWCPDWELCRLPGGFGLQSCLACQPRRVRPARRPRAHSVLCFRVLGFKVLGF